MTEMRTWRATTPVAPLHVVGIATSLGLDVVDTAEDGFEMSGYRCRLVVRTTGGRTSLFVEEEMASGRDLPARLSDALAGAGGCEPVASEPVSLPRSVPPSPSAPSPEDGSDDGLDAPTRAVSDRRRVASPPAGTPPGSGASESQTSIVDAAAPGAALPQSRRSHRALVVASLFAVVLVIVVALVAVRASSPSPSAAPADLSTRGGAASSVVGTGAVPGSIDPSVSSSTAPPDPGPAEVPPIPPAPAPTPTATPAPPPTLAGDPEVLLRNATVTDPDQGGTVQLHDGVGKLLGDDDYAKPGYLRAQVIQTARGTRWPAIGIISFNWGGSGQSRVVMALDPGGNVILSEDWGDRNQIKGLSEENGLVRVDFLEFGADDSMATGGSIPSWLTFDPATKVLSKKGPKPYEATSVGIDPAGMTTDGVAPLNFGDPLSKATAMSGKGAQPACGGGYGASTLEIVPGLTLGFSGDEFVSYWTTSASYSTPSGGRVGMTTSELKAKIPKASREVVANMQDAFVVRSGENSVVFSISANGRISSIAAGKHMEQAGEFC